jgi:hypothetical protein
MSDAATAATHVPDGRADGAVVAIVGALSGLLLHVRQPMVLVGENEHATVRGWRLAGQRCATGALLHGSLGRRGRGGRRRAREHLPQPRVEALVAVPDLLQNGLQNDHVVEHCVLHQVHLPGECWAASARARRACLVERHVCVKDHILHHAFRVRCTAHRYACSVTRAQRTPTSTRARRLPRETHAELTPGEGSAERRRVAGSWPHSRHSAEPHQMSSRR